MVKLVIDEDGSDVAVDLWDRYPSAASVLIHAETRAALAAARRAGRLTARDHRAALEELEAIGDELDTVAVGEPLGRRAGELAEQHGLRGYDAVHLASALLLGAADVILVTWDAALARAAIEAGLSVAPAP